VYVLPDEEVSKDDIIKAVKLLMLSSLSLPQVYFTTI